MGGSDKTEKPTPRKVQKAREQGQVAKSTDFNAALVLGSVSAVILMMGSYLYGNFYSMLVGTFADLDQYAKAPMTVNSLSYIIYGTINSIFWMLLPVLAVVTVVAIFSNLIQVKPLFSPQAVQPKFEKLNPINGFKRLFSKRSVVEVLKGSAKIAVIAWLAYSIINNHFQALLASQSMDIQVVWFHVLGIIGEIAAWSCVAFFIIGVIDWRYQAWQLEEQLKMTKQEVKDERKSQEGDPMVKGRMRQMGMQFIKKRQLAAVATADVVITNPTHFAIAIKYDPDVAPAPMVVAKGVDHFALKIREAAKENKVPMVENKPLARSLYKAVDVDQMITPELFVAVAEVMAFIFSKNKGRKLKRKSK
ncbi:MAG: flagellar biosynthesis protein FlhB [Vampirovibrionales bacterium]|nr:flagellar biosynthesis protein FlhB [Vampirovibrionales bacterium]